jgi:hypothetical protein
MSFMFRTGAARLCRWLARLTLVVVVVVVVVVAEEEEQEFLATTVDRLLPAEQRRNGRRCTW